jgi:hypothetical protein
MSLMAISQYDLGSMLLLIFGEQKGISSQYSSPNGLVFLENN